MGKTSAKMYQENSTLFLLMFTNTIRRDVGAPAAVMVRCEEEVLVSEYDVELVTIDSLPFA